MNLTQESFDRLLAWLDTNRDEAGRKYELIRLKLIKVLTNRGCTEAEILVDEIINRVASKAGGLAESYVGDPALYFYGVARNVLLEHSKRKPLAAVPPPEKSSDEIEREHECLDRCMQRLPDINRAMILRYYQEDRRAKAECRQALAQELGIATNALRIRAHRIRAVLERCVHECLEETTRNETYPGERHILNRSPARSEEMLSE